MNTKLHFLAEALTEMGALYRKGVPASGLRVLMYHAIGSRIPSDAQGRYTLSPVLFAQHMKILKGSHLTTPLGVPDSIPAVAVTFDDGYRDNFTEAYPVLSMLDIPFTIFVTSDYIRSGDSLYLSPSELRTLSNDPLVTIGAHGESHTPFTRLTSGALRKEL
ncbi:polysaccharide deacetylase family protein, partial [bacterium]|nr:polysaccharide deacetylase family protein [bacterium]